jgi:hypothetical protein
MIFYCFDDDFAMGLTIIGVFDRLGERRLILHPRQRGKDEKMSHYSDDHDRLHSGRKRVAEFTVYIA